MVGKSAGKPAFHGMFGVMYGMDIGIVSDPVNAHVVPQLVE
jgi:hypothetical protein